MRKNRNGQATHVPGAGAKPVQQHGRGPHRQGAAMGNQPGPGLPANEHGARADPIGRPPRWEFRDARASALVIATGPSSEPYGPADWPDWPAVCVNDAWERHPDACALYAADERWWHSSRHPSGASHLHRTRTEFRGARYTSTRWGPFSDSQDITRLEIDIREGLGKAPGNIRSGGLVGNSGAQALNLAFRWGARRIILVGFDMCRRDGKEHRFGDHPKGLTNGSAYAAFIKGMGGMAADLHREGVEVINACPWSALPYWPKTTLERLR